MKARTLAAGGVATLLLALTPALALARDSDKDGLPNRWEAKQTPDGLKLTRFGAKPDHKDVFVEVEFANGVDRGDVPCGELDALYRVFKTAPVTNPDGKKGVNMHIDAGITCPSRKYDLGGSSRFQAQPCSSPADLGNSLAAKRLPVFHQAGVVAQGSLCGSEGIAFESDFMLEVQGGGSFAHVFMHEFGHVFGLDHGPLTSFSVMSRVLIGYPGQEIHLDYNRYPIAALNENALSEPAGFQSTPAGEAYLSHLYASHSCYDPGSMTFSVYSGGSANANVDWDCDGAPFYMPPQSQYIDPDPVAADINGDGQLTVIPASPPEWPLLQYGAGRIGG